MTENRKETVEGRHLECKLKLRVIISTLAEQGVITTGIAQSMLSIISKIEDNPFVLLSDVEGKPIRCSRRNEEGKEEEYSVITIFSKINHPAT